MHVQLFELAARQRDLVAAWQLVAAAWTRAMVEQHAADHRWRRIHSGVYATGYAALTPEQVRMAATLTAPRTYLSHASAGAHYGIWSFQGRFETVTRPGTTGRRTHDGLLVSHSRTLEGDTATHDGIPITTPERTIIDLGRDRPLREALRLKLTTPCLMAVSLEKHRGRRGTHRLAKTNDRYSGLPYSRTRSNAEAKAHEVIHDAGGDPPQVNKRIAGEEADLCWPDRRRIVEIDGPQYHLIKDEDDRKQRIWEEAGYTVERISSDDIYGAPERLMALVPRL